MNNNEIFLEFWKNYQWPEQPVLYFRLYHDKDGSPIKYSRYHEPGSYIEVSPEEFAVARMDIKVVQGKITYPPPPRPTTLRPGPDGISCHPYDVTVVVDKTFGECVNWKMQ